jgi:hypothetical protein
MHLSESPSSECATLLSRETRATCSPHKNWDRPWPSRGALTQYNMVTSSSGNVRNKAQTQKTPLAARYVLVPLPCCPSHVYSRNSHLTGGRTSAEESEEERTSKEKN